MTMKFGPVDLIVLEFKGNKFKGEIMPALINLVDKEIIRLIDLVIIQKDNQGKVFLQELQQADNSTIQLFDPLKVEITGMIKKEDLDMIAEHLENNSTAAAMLFENLWAKRFVQAALDAKGRVLMQLRIPAEIVAEAVQELEAEVKE